MRCGQLTRAAGASARELSELARTFLRRADDQLYVGIYYSRWLIEQLERHDPRSGINDANIRSLIAFVEEINHALHAALQFKRGVREIASEDFARNLELQAQVDTYLVLLLFVAFFRKTQKVSRTDRRWLRFHLFASQNPHAFRMRNLRGALPRNDGLASSYTHYLDALNGARRLDEIRIFHALDYGAKKARVLALMDKPIDRYELDDPCYGRDVEAFAAANAGRIGACRRRARCSPRQAPLHVSCVKELG